MEERLIEITLLFIYAGKSLPGFPEDRLTSRSGTKTVDLAGDKLHVVGAYTIYTHKVPGLYRLGVYVSSYVER